jgi:hypothetical protein
MNAKASRTVLITGTFLDGLACDIPSQNWGAAEWAQQFDVFREMGMDTVIIIRVGWRDLGMYPSRVMPTPIVERDDLVQLFLDESQRTGLRLYMGGYDVSRVRLHRDVRSAGRRRSGGFGKAAHEVAAIAAAPASTVAVGSSCQPVRVTASRPPSKPPLGTRFGPAAPARGSTLSQTDAASPPRERRGRQPLIGLSLLGLNRRRQAAATVVAATSVQRRGPTVLRSIGSKPSDRAGEVSAKR